MIVHPLSDMNLFAPGQRYEPIPANFPGLKHFFKCNEATGAIPIADAASSLTIKASDNSTLTNNADGTISFGAVQDTIVSGAIASPGAKKMLLIWAGKPGSTLANITLGNVADGTWRGIRSTANGSGTNTPAVKFSDGTGVTITGTVGLAGNGTQMQVRCLVLDWGTDATGGTYGMTPYDFDGTTWTARAATSIAASTSGIAAITQAITIQANLNPAFIQVWHLTKVPENIRNAVTWMYAMATTAAQGYRKLAYPGWAGLS